MSKADLLLAERIKHQIGMSVRTVVVNCGSLPRSAGKAARILDPGGRP